MSQKNDTKVLVSALLLTGIIAGVLFWWMRDWVKDKNNQISVQTITSSPGPTPSPPPSKPPTPLVAERIGLGEKILVEADLTSASPAFKVLKQAGIDAIAKGKYNEAVSQLSAAVRENGNSPETLIYLNNARIGQQKAYTIAVVVPIGSDSLGALEVLRGVAQAQDEINQAGGINKTRLKVAIANDDNNPDIAKQIASALVNNPDVLGVVGHWASQVTLATAPVYDSGKLVAISPVSTAVDLSSISRYIFRTVPSDFVAAGALADYMLTKLQRKNVAVFFNSQSTYSKSLKSQFGKEVSLRGGQVLNEFDLSEPGFNARQSVEQAIGQGAEVLMLAPNTGVLEKVWQVVQVNQNRLSLLGGDDVYSLETLKNGAAAAEGMVVAVPWDIDGDRTSDFPSKARKMWGADVNWRTALAYDAVRALSAAIESSPTRTGIQQTLSSSTFSVTGASGIVRFLPSGDRNGNVQLVKIVRNSSGTGYDFVPVPR